MLSDTDKIVLIDNHSGESTEHKQSIQQNEPQQINDSPINSQPTENQSNTNIIANHDNNQSLKMEHPQNPQNLPTEDKSTTNRNDHSNSAPLFNSNNIVISPFLIQSNQIAQRSIEESNTSPKSQEISPKTAVENDSSNQSKDHNNQKDSTENSQPKEQNSSQHQYPQRNDRFNYRPENDKQSSSTGISIVGQTSGRVQPNPPAKRSYNTKPYNNRSYNNSSSRDSNWNRSNSSNGTSLFFDKTNPIKIEVKRPNTPIQIDSNKAMLKTASQSIKIEHSQNTLSVTRSLSSDLKSKSDSGIKIEKASTQSDSKGFTLESSKDTSETCPLCGSVSLPFQDLMNHIIVSHKFGKILNETFRYSNNLELCNKCNQRVDEAQLVRHCVDNHLNALFEMFRDRCNSQFPKREKEIELFFKKHAPEINPKFQRSYDISTSSDDEEDDMSKNRDEEFTAFIASTIQTKGLATSTSIEPIFDPTKLESKKTDRTSSAVDYVALLSDYEIFLRSYQLFFETTDSNGHEKHFSCKVCRQRKTFDTFIRLVDHVVQQHRLIVTGHMKRALCIMSSSVNDQMDERELMKIPNISLDLILYPVLKDNANSPQHLLNVPQIFIDFLLETLSVSQPVVNHLHTPKIFSEPTKILVRLPTPLPITFLSKSPGIVQLGFFDTSVASASRIQEIVNRTLDNLALTEVLNVQFEYMNKDIGFTDEELMDFADDLQIELLKTDDIIDENGTRSFSILILIPRWSKTPYGAIEQRLNKLFEDATMVICKKCHEIYDGKTNLDCVGPKASGLTIQVKGGKHEPEGIISKLRIDKIELGQWKPPK